MLSDLHRSVLTTVVRGRRAWCRPEVLTLAGHPQPLIGELVAAGLLAEWRLRPSILLTLTPYAAELMRVDLDEHLERDGEDLVETPHWVAEPEDLADLGPIRSRWRGHVTGLHLEDGLAGLGPDEDPPAIDPATGRPITTDLLGRVTIPASRVATDPVTGGPLLLFAGRVPVTIDRRRARECGPKGPRKSRAKT